MTAKVSSIEVTVAFRTLPSSLGATVIFAVTFIPNRCASEPLERRARSTAPAKLPVKFCGWIPAIGEAEENISNLDRSVRKHFADLRDECSNAARKLAGVNGVSGAIFLVQKNWRQKLA